MTVIFQHVDGAWTARVAGVDKPTGYGGTMGQALQSLLDSLVLRVVKQGATQ